MDLDDEEKFLLSNSKIKRLSVDELNLKPIETISNLYFKPLAKKVKQIYLHIDLDVLDITDLKANQFASAAGIKLNKLLEILSEVKSIFKIAAVAFTAYDPRFDENNKASKKVIAILKIVLSI